MLLCMKNANSLLQLQLVSPQSHLTKHHGLANSTERPILHSDWVILLKPNVFPSISSEHGSIKILLATFHHQETSI